MILKGYLFSLLYGLLCLALGFVAYKLGMQKKYTRKLVHILVGFEWVILYVHFGASIHFLVVALIFTLLLAVTYFAKLTPMISSDADNAPGTVYYGIAMSLMAGISVFVPEMLVPFGVGVFATSLGDGAAGLIGQLVKRFNPKIYGEKSFVGTLTGFLVSFFVALAFKKIFSLDIGFFECLMIGFFAASLELISSYGLDNISVTLGVSLLVYLMLYQPFYINFIVPIIITPAIIALVLKRRALTPAATLLALALDFTVSIALGNYGFILLLLFLVGGVVIDKIKEKRLRDDGISKKGSCRDHIQVLANGFLPMVSAAAYLITGKNAFLFTYVACLAEALADTAASGFGVFSKNTYNIIKFKRCDKGLSGGVSLSGSLAALVFSFIIPTMAWIFGMIAPEMIPMLSILAFIGVVFDSVIGSLFQVKYRCIVCNSITEREVHCGVTTEKFSGISFVDNDAVNLFSGLFTAILVLIISLYI